MNTIRLTMAQALVRYLCARGTAAGGAWRDVAVAEISDRQEVRDARRVYDPAWANGRG